MANYFKEIPELSISDMIRFWSRISSQGKDECWEWYERGRTSNGYGKFFISGDEFAAHRVTWFLTHGENPGEFDICHRCDNPPCCNPSHLFIGTRSENLRDMVKKGRWTWRDMRGSRNGNSKLIEEQVMEIKTRYATESLGVKRLAREYRVAQSLIFRIIRGEAWSHLPILAPTELVRASKLSRKHLSRKLPI